MPDNKEFESIFTRLRPIHTSRRQDSEKAARRARFQIETAGGRLMLRCLDPDADTRKMTQAEARLFSELERIRKDFNIFDISFTSEGNAGGVSFADNPHLVAMLPGAGVNGPDGIPLEFSADPMAIVLEITTTPDSDMAAVSLRMKGEDIDTDAFIMADSCHALHGHTLYAVADVGDNFASLPALAVPVEKRSLDSFLTLFLTYTSNVRLSLNGTAARTSAHPEHAVPTLYFEKVAADKALYLRTAVTIESLAGQLPPGFQPTRVAHVADNDRITIRNVEGSDITPHLERLESLILSCASGRAAKKEIYCDGDFFIVPEEVAGPFLLNKLPQVLEDFRLVGSEKLKEYKIVAASPSLNIKFSSGIDFLEGEGDVEIGPDHFSIADILRQYSSKKYVQLSDGNRGIIDESYINRLQRLFRMRDKDGRLKVNLFNLPDVEEMIQDKIKGTFANRSRKVLEGFNALKSQKAPAYKVKATLRGYQQEGVKWLRYLYDNKLGGCLADDMGLGKTLQTIALLSLIYPKEKTPSLIVMPRSLLFNWEKELARFAPKITFSTYYGPDRDLDKALESNVVLTTYAIVRNDIMTLKDVKFQMVVLDESQNIKNVSAQTTSAVLLLDSDHRLALSGTPMENNLTELYSLFRFLNPAMFGSLEDFNSSYTYPIQKGDDKAASDSLRRKIFPFILRRLKKEVLSDLPDRIDQTIYVEMTDTQKRLYEERRKSFRQQISKTIATEGVSKSQFMLFQALSELRRIASVPESLSDGKIASPKIEELKESLISSVSNGHKSVVFFNFIAGIEILMEKLDHLGIGYETMTGSSSANERKRIVERFQTDPDCMVLLLTLKVGGVGLNLTAADTVYIFEPWWNKAAEEQAVNRLHRIGQKSTVSAFSIITVGTIEEKIIQLQQQKSELFNNLISSDSASAKNLTEKDIDFILS